MDWESTGWQSGEPVNNSWFAGTGAFQGWDIYNAAACVYYTHDYARYWQHVDASNSWNFYNGTAWVSTDDSG